MYKTVNKNFTAFAMIVGNKDITDMTTQTKLIEGINFKEYSPYLSVFDNVNSGYKPIAENFKFKHNEWANEEISFFDENGRNGSRTDKRAIQLKSNDLMSKPIEIVINMTGKRVTISDKNGRRKSYEHIDGGKLGENTQLTGKLAILQLEYFNNPEQIKLTQGIDNYLDYHISELQKIIELDGPRAWTLRTLQYLNEKFKEACATEPTIHQHASIGVYSIMTFFEQEVKNMEKQGNWYVPELDSIISFDTIVSTPLSPSFLHNTQAFDAVRDMMQYPTFTQFLNDPECKVRDKYVACFGNAVKIPRKSLSSQEEGLYSITTRGGRIAIKFECSLEDLVNHPDYFDSEEEAIEGLRRLDKKKAELQELELDTRQVITTKQAEIADLNLSNRTEQTVFERERRETKAQEELQTMLQNNFKFLHEELAKRDKRLEQIEELQISRVREMNKLEEDKYDWKMEAMRESEKARSEMIRASRKDYYEERSYERSDTLETLKTTAAIAGVVSTGILLYSKFAK